MAETKTRSTWTGGTAMKDEDRTRELLIDELREMRGRVGEWEVSEMQHKRTEESLLQRDSEFRAIFQAFPDLYFRLDSDGIILDYNAGCTSYFYVPPEVFLGKRMQSVLPFDVGQQFQGAIAKVLRTKSLVNIEYSLPMPKGDRAYEARLLPLFEGQIIVVVRDVTEHRKLNEDLRRRTLELEEKNKELEAFSYSVSHDLRTPLLVIEGFARKLLEKYSNQLDAKGQQFLDIIYRNTQRMQQLIEDLLTFSHVEHQKMKWTEINMAELSKTVFEDLRNVDPEQTLMLGTLPSAFGDKSMIRQVLFNLLSNAFKFTRPKGRGVIEIGGKVEESRSIYYVKDNGIGFDMDCAPKLFNAFQRLHNPDEFEGTGVGLAIVKRIIQRHGGWVWGEGKENEGATFYFALPAEQSVLPKKAMASAGKSLDGIPTVGRKALDG